MMIMNIEMTDKEYCYVNTEINNIYGISWNNIKHSNKIEIIENILLHVN